MEQSINKVELLGRLGSDPRITQTEEGRRVARFNLATSEITRSANGELREDTTWHRVVVWEGREGATWEALRKGARVRVQGRIHVSSYQKDGLVKYSTEIVAQRLEIVT